MYRLCGARSGSPPKTPFNSNVDLSITHVKMYQRDGDSTMTTYSQCRVSVCRELICRSVRGARSVCTLCACVHIFPFAFLQYCSMGYGLVPRPLLYLLGDHGIYTHGSTRLQSHIDQCILFDLHNYV